LNAFPKAGFTLVELLVSLAVIGILGVTFVTYLSTSYFGSLQQQDRLQLGSTLQAANRTMSDELSLSSGILTTGTLTDTYAPVGGWVTSSSTLVTTSPALDNVGNIIYTATNVPYTNEIVYFVTSNTLYRRVIKNPAVTGNAALTTCPQIVANSSCPADGLVTSNVHSLTFTLLDADGAPATATNARLVTFTLALQKTSYNTTINSSRAETVRLRNKL
jgi:prepilin-type N-terminal cleavage/methylation domain-containing protein